MINLRFPFIFPFKIFVCIALALVLGCARASLTATSAQEPEDVVRVETSLVQLNVGVVDRQGRAITNLSRNDFTVYEDGVRQSIASFEPTAAPFSLVLLLDMSGSTLSFRATLKQAALRFIDALAPEDRVAVVAFNNKVEILTGFTSRRKKIANAIFIAEGKGETHFYKALNFALEQLAKEGKRRKAIVVMTDGLDTQMRNLDRASASHAQTDEEAVASIKPEASAALSAVLNAADRQGVTIYPLALPSGDPKRLPLPSPTITAIYRSARARMQMLAERTGGRLSEINRLEDLGRLYAEVAADLRTLYSIAYQPSGARARDGGWRSIHIEVTQPELIARTRPGYYAR
ncbi:MAG TPA: VWA domain-containing protein [Pyrinomonadaceae bacterium]|nr:VWA domain-containing protein [Pyrinomonadaceae bacterium]